MRESSSTTMELAGLGTWDLDLQSDRREYDSVLLGLLGVPVAHHDTADYFAAVHPDDRERIAELTALAARDGSPYRAELRVRRADGEWRSFETNVQPERDAGGDVRWLRGVVQDVTERRRATADIEESRAAWRALVQSAPAVIARLDPDGTIRFVNRASPGRSLEEVTGRPWLELVHPADREELRAILASVVATGLPRSYEARSVRPDGTVGWYSATMGPIRIGAEIAGVVVTAIDVTEQKRTEARLVETERLASVGMLAAGVAHEINNPLTAVIANLDLALLGVGQPGGRAASELGESLQEARDAAERVRRVAGDLRVFSRSELEPPRPTDIEHVLDSCVRMAWTEIRHRARVTKHYLPVPPVLGSDSRLGQVFLNLLVNAAHAIPEGRADENELGVSTSTDAEGRVVVEVRDTGTGMAPDVLEQLFTPFFTTKPPGSGTGLGLSICQRIVTSLGGEISVESELGKGTSFRVTLQAAPASDVERPSAAPREAAGPDPQHRCRVMVVDDEPAIGSAVRRMLANQADVVAVTAASDALRRIVGGERYDAILCDLMMPHMTGAELHALLAAQAPDQAERMVFVTGGAFTPGARAFLAGVRNACVEKPFDAVQIKDAIAELCGWRAHE